MNAQTAVKEPTEIGEPAENGCIELSDEELLTLIDTQVRESLHISGEEFLRRYRERKPIVNDLGQPVPAWSPLASLAWLLDDQQKRLLLVAFSARTPLDAFRLLQNHCNHTLNKILTDYRLRLTVRNARQERTVLSFFNDKGEQVAVPLGSSPWYLFINQRLQAVPQGRDYILKVLAQEYRIQRTPSRDDEAEVRFEYVSPEIDPDFPYNRHHVQFHRDFQDVCEGFSPINFISPQASSLSKT